MSSAAGSFSSDERSLEGPHLFLTDDFLFCRPRPGDRSLGGGGRDGHRYGDRDRERDGHGDRHFQPVGDSDSNRDCHGLNHGQYVDAVPRDIFLHGHGDDHSGGDGLRRADVDSSWRFGLVLLPGFLYDRKYHLHYGRLPGGLDRVRARDVRHLRDGLHERERRQYDLGDLSFDGRCAGHGHAQLLGASTLQHGLRDTDHVSEWEPIVLCLRGIGGMPRRVRDWITDIHNDGVAIGDADVHDDRELDRHDLGHRRYADPMSGNFLVYGDGDCERWLHADRVGDRHYNLIGERLRHFDHV